MNVSADTRWKEIDRLIDGVCDQTLSASESAELSKWLVQDPSACDHYISYMAIHRELACQWMPPIRFSPAELSRYSEAELDLLHSETNSGRLADLPSPATPTLGFLSTAFHGPVGWFSSGWPMAYLVATLIFGIGLVIGSLVPVSEPEQVAKQSVFPSTGTDRRLVGRGAGGEGSENAADSHPVVGRITGMVDCEWEGSGFRVQSSEPVVSGQWSVVSGQKQSESRSSSHQPPATSHFVSLGDTFALASGLMEITYDTGARVILQGPVTYEVESKNSGYLSVGKLTARLEKKVASGQWSVVSKSEIPNPQSLIPNPLFAVRTPTAIVTDLGTEFGVEVGKEGRTKVHVLQGMVEARPTGVRGVSPPAQRVTEGRAVEITPNADQFKLIAFAPRSFVRTLQPSADTPAEAAYIKAVLADKPMGYWPLNEPAHARKFLDRSGNGIHGYAMNRVMAGQAGPLPGNSHAVALDGKGYIDFGLRNQFAMKNDFTVEAWVWIGKGKVGGYIISVLGPDENKFIGWGMTAGYRDPVSRSDAENPIVFDFPVYQVGHFHSAPFKGELIENRWLHVAATFDRANTVHLYLNGEPCGSIAASGPARVGPVWVTIGCAQIVDADFWRGRLAHVAVYPRALGAQQIQNHYDEAFRAITPDQRKETQ